MAHKMFLLLMNCFSNVHNVIDQRSISFSYYLNIIVFGERRSSSEERGGQTEIVRQSGVKTTF